jgi:Restriction endonuclease AspBHI N-terminal
VRVSARSLGMHDLLRYARSGSDSEAMIDGYLNYYFVMSTPGVSSPKLMLERGISANTETAAVDGPRRSVIAIRSSPWKAGHETNPWHDEFDLDHGHVRYYGDHKPGTVGLPGATPGNRLLLEAFQLHAGTDRVQRLLAPPLLLFRSRTVHVSGRAVVKGNVEFCGAALIERLEHVVQRDPAKAFRT